MELWYTEEHHKGVRYSILVKKHLYSGKSDYQRIDVIDTVFYGKMLILDGLVMLSERDESAYHEMISHIPAFTHPGPKTALVIGGGDGGTVRELLRHPSIEHIDLVEIDRQVVDISKEFFPELTSGLKDCRVSIHYRDGIKFVKQTSDRYDLALVDSIDPIGPAAGLFQIDFYRDVYHCLSEDGILTAQAESPLFGQHISQAMVESLKTLFPLTFKYQSFIPTYPSGHWLFILASKKHHPTKNYRLKDALSMEKEFKYYNAELHKAAFALPTWVRNPQIEPEDDD